MSMPHRLQTSRPWRGYQRALIKPEDSALEQESGIFGCPGWRLLGQAGLGHAFADRSLRSSCQRWASLPGKSS